MRPLFLATLAASLFVTAYAQDKSQAEQTSCKVRFAVYQSNPHVPGGMTAGMSKEQGKWYEKNKKDYAAVCLDGEKPDYVVVWSSRFSSEGEPEPIIFSGATTGVAQPVESERVYLSIFREPDVKRAQADKSYQARPVYYTHHESWWTYRKSHQMAMEDALKFLAQAPLNGDLPQGTSEGAQKSTAPSDSQQTGTVTVTSTPDGADVYADGAFVGNAPAILKLSPAKHTIRVGMRGYKGWDREITVQPGSQLNLKAALEKEE